MATYLSRDVDAVTTDAALAVLAPARYVMAGPGSPSYALRNWLDSPIPEALADLLRRGGGLTMASAAALTVGALTIPVYEIYKVGAPATWLEGLDLLGRATGLRAAIVPHYDNAEGGTHDTRFCYIGERRLIELESQIDDSTFVLGVDSHTAITFDLDQKAVSVAGRGGMTVRARGRSTVFPSGSEVPIATLTEVAARLAAGDEADIGWEPAPHVRRPAHPAISAPGGSDDAAEHATRVGPSWCPHRRRPIPNPSSGSSGTSRTFGAASAPRVSSRRPTRSGTPSFARVSRFATRQPPDRRGTRCSRRGMPRTAPLDDHNTVVLNARSMPDPAGAFWRGETSKLDWSRG